MSNELDAFQQFLKAFQMISFEKGCLSFHLEENGML